MAQDDVKDFVDRDLRGARFNRSTLAGAVMRGVDVDALDIDAPWLAEGTFLINGVDVVPLVEAELNRRFPGRDLRHADNPDDLRVAWAALERAWAAAVDRAVSMPEGAVDVSIDGEWSFAQTLRHLAFAADTWLGKSILRLPQPFHPLGQPHAEYETEGFDVSIFAVEQPTFAATLELRAERQAMVRDFLVAVTPELLAETRPAAWWPEKQVSVLHCLHVIVGEEWQHLRFALRDLDAQG
ncbi:MULTISPECIES: DinB family protein [Micromonospora]|uniref:DinB family protein n=1 Tax=Micromonospora TaxID=1873 RepID=UPI001EE7BB11|nr:DinB family protein [Micromonospora hortensis]MCG5448062.1 DinB family protein [Micromonospora hortensis]WTI06725.1 DinB family protein [Micromonospora sp. NBC_00821]